MELGIIAKILGDTLTHSVTSGFPNSNISITDRRLYAYFAISLFHIYYNKSSVLMHIRTFRKLVVGFSRSYQK